MSSLPTPLRRQLEKAIQQARNLAEAGARHALEALAVHEPDPYPHMSETQRGLRRQLRAQARQLGDGESRQKPGGYEIKHLAEKLAYDQWHRLLFARYLLENNLLISPEHGVAVALDDCEELAPSLGLKDAWAVAARFAAKELPEIFRADDPAGAVELSVNDRKPLIALVTGLPVEVFTATDSLGWCYQYWQAEKKTEINAAGNKIGADELPAVTQLFTEQYMVAFLLENALGGWWASRHPSTKLPVEMPYLRFVEKGAVPPAPTFGTPAAGTFPAWPDTLAQFKLLDPCTGSGHFLVSAFHYLVPMRLATEKISVRDAIDRVLADNLYGLELDARCVEIAAFALALAAWRYPDENGNPIGHHPLPRLNIACVGVAPRSKKADWLKLAGGDERLERGMETLYTLFQKAPELGSLIDPMAATRGDLLDAHWQELESRLDQALTEKGDDQDIEARVAAQGMAHASRILTRKYHLVITNPPYLGAAQHGPVLKDYCEENYKAAKGDLANVFLDRSLKLCTTGGAVSFVMPQNWLFLGRYKKQREHLLRYATWNLLARLGEHGFDSTDAAGAFTILLTLTHAKPSEDQMLRGLDASASKAPEEKAEFLRGHDVSEASQLGQLSNPDGRIALDESDAEVTLLGRYAISMRGIVSGDGDKWIRYFWEQSIGGTSWRYLQSVPEKTQYFGGKQQVINWETSGNGMLRPGSENLAYGNKGIAMGQMRSLPATTYCGALYDNNTGVIVPNDPLHLAAIWCFCSAPVFTEAVRRIDQKMNVTNATLVKVPFDLAHWQKVATERYPNGLPKPYSDDPTQWIFHGHPNPATDPLQVAVARLLGYHWPAESDAEIELSDDARAWIARCTDLEGLIDDDGIVCLSTTKGEAPAAERLRGLLVKAFGDFDLAALLASAGSKGKSGSRSATLEAWLRDEFFEQHCALFDHRPFIWHLWDGHKCGFSALVNYHKLDHANLEKLTYAYLGDWIRRQQAALDAGEAGSDARLQAAKTLQGRLKLILEGEPPFDLFSRWKPLAQQAIGWHPDLNDGVRLNIRPFLAQDIPGGKKGAGLLRGKPNISWGPKADRGKEPERAKAEFPWFWGWDEATQDFAGVGKEPDGNRWNDCHYSNQFKQAAREASKTR